MSRGGVYRGSFVSADTDTDTSAVNPTRRPQPTNLQRRFPIRSKIQRYKDTNEVLKWPVCDDMVEPEMAKAPDLSSGEGGHGGVLGFSPNPRRYDETMASKWDRRTQGVGIVN